jgi:hypothetical protein
VVHSEIVGDPNLAEPILHGIIHNVAGASMRKRRIFEPSAWPSNQRKTSFAATGRGASQGGRHRTPAGFISGQVAGFTLDAGAASSESEVHRRPRLEPLDIAPLSTPALVIATATSAISRSWMSGRVADIALGRLIMNVEDERPADGVRRAVVEALVQEQLLCPTVSDP